MYREFWSSKPAELALWNCWKNVISRRCLEVRDEAQRSFPSFCDRPAEDIFPRTFYGTERGPGPWPPVALLLEPRLRDFTGEHDKVFYGSPKLPLFELFGFAETWWNMRGFGRKENGVSVFPPVF